jgi:hypothetical protein
VARPQNPLVTSSDQVQIQALSQRILIKCAHRLGGVGALARHLEISEGTLAEWLNGTSVPPVELIMKAVTPLIGELEPVPSQEIPVTRRPA